MIFESTPPFREVVSLIFLLVRGLNVKTDVVCFFYYSEIFI